jgi:hypothetical protein
VHAPKENFIDRAWEILVLFLYRLEIIPFRGCTILTSNFKADKLTETIIHIADEKRPQTVKELITLVQENAPWSQTEILDAVLKLQDEEKIGLVGSSLSVTLKFSTYMRTNKVLWYWTTVTIAIMSVVFTILIKEGFYPWNYFRNVFGLIFVLWLPGYTFLKVLFPVNVPKTELSTNLSNEERIALSVIMSLALIILIGLLLNFLPWGINLTTIVLSLLMFSMIFANAAVVKDYTLMTKGNGIRNYKSY